MSLLILIYFNECGSTRPWVKSAWVKSARVNSARLYRPGPILPTRGNIVWFYLYCRSVNLVSLNGFSFITVVYEENIVPYKHNSNLNVYNKRGGQNYIIFRRLLLSAVPFMLGQIALIMCPFYPPTRKGSGDIAISLASVRLSVCPSVRPSVRP